MSVYPGIGTFPGLATYPSGPQVATGEILSDIDYTVEVIWADPELDIIQFGISYFDGVDHFAENWQIDFDTPESVGYQEEILNVLSITIDRGRDDNLNTFNMGTCTVKVSDPEGRYNPNNESGALYGFLNPMQQIRVRVNVGGLAETYLFRGFIRNIDYDAYTNQGVATFSCADLFLYLGTVKPTFTTSSSTPTTGETLSAALLGSAYINPTYTSISASSGDTLPSQQTNTSSGESFLDILTNVLATERGDFYIAADSTATYVDRNEKYTSPVRALISNVASEATVTSDVGNVKNRAVVIKDNPDPTPDVTQTWVDAQSVSSYGLRDFSTISSDLFQDDAQALSLAQWLVSQRAQPGTPYRSIGVTVNALSYLDGFYLLAAAELGSKVVVENTTLGQSADYYFIEAIQHEIVPNKHTASYRLTPGNAVLVLDDATTVLDYSRLGY